MITATDAIMSPQSLSTRAWRKNGRCLLVLLVLVILFITFWWTPLRRGDQTVIDVTLWLKTPYVACGGNFTGYGNEFAVLRYGKLSKTKEFSIGCVGKLPEYKFLYGKEGTPLNIWMKSLQRLSPIEISASNVVVMETTVAVMRYEAHNIYHTMTDWYNVFIITKLLNLDPKKVTILFMDDRPPGLMDDTWRTLFGKVMRHSDVQPNFVFKTLIWNILGYESPINFHRLVELPFVNEFHNFFVSSFGIHKMRTLDCSNITAAIIWRRDYMTHPERNIEVEGGLVHRKFKNENEILSEVKSVLSGHTVTSVVLEQMSMKDQLDVFANTDILIGMHGAGMAHVMFLPPHAAIFEMFPNYWGFLIHFKAFSRWRGLKYLGWQNNDQANEFPGFYTYIPPDVVRSHVQELKDYLCKPL